MSQCKQDVDCPPGHRCNTRSREIWYDISAALVVAVGLGVSSVAAKKKKKALGIVILIVAIVVGAAAVAVGVLTKTSSCQAVCQNVGDVYSSVCKRCVKRCNDDSYIDCATNMCLAKKTDQDCFLGWDSATGRPKGAVKVASDDGRSCTTDVPDGRGMQFLDASCKATDCHAQACQLSKKAKFDRYDASNQMCVVDCELPDLVKNTFEIPLCANVDFHSGGDGTCSTNISDVINRACAYDESGCKFDYSSTGSGSCVFNGIIVPAEKPGCRPSNVNASVVGGVTCIANSAVEALEFVQPEPAYAWPPQDGVGATVEMSIGVRYTGDDGNRPFSIRYVVYPITSGNANEVSNRAIDGTYKNQTGAIVFGSDGFVYFVAKFHLSSSVSVDSMRIGLFGLGEDGKVTSVMKNANAPDKYGSTFVSMRITSMEQNVDQNAKVLNGDAAKDAWNRGAWFESSVGRTAFENLFKRKMTDGDTMNPFRSIKTFESHAVVMFPGHIGQLPSSSTSWNEVAVVFAINVASADAKPYVAIFDGTSVNEIALAKGDDWGIQDNSVVWVVLRAIVGIEIKYLVGAYLDGAKTWSASDQRSPLKVVKFEPVAYDAVTCADMRPIANTWTSIDGVLMMKSESNMNGMSCMPDTSDKENAATFYCLATQNGQVPSVTKTVDEETLAQNKQLYVWKGGACRAVERNDTPVFIIPTGSEPSGGSQKMQQPHPFTATVDFAGEQCLDGVPLSIGLRCGAVSRSGGVYVSDVPLFDTDGGVGPIVSTDDIKNAVENAKQYAKQNNLPIADIDPDIGMKRMYGCDFSKNSNFEQFQRAAPGGGWPWVDVRNAKFPDRYMSRVDTKWLPPVDKYGVLGRYCCVNMEDTYAGNEWSLVSGKGHCNCMKPANSEWDIYPEHCAWVGEKASDTSSWNNQTAIDIGKNVSIKDTACIYDVLNPSSAPRCECAKPGCVVVS